jgi:DNA polymerase
MDWKYLVKELESCQRCPLSKTRTNVVIGSGNKSSDILIVGEGPGYNEDIKGEAFVGKAGQLLDKILHAVELSRDNVYITNIVKCRPPDNRDPLNEEKETCLPFLRKQFLLIKPRITLCLGRVAAQTLIEPDFKITKSHGEWYEKKGYLFIATYHPAALLRDPSKKKDTWEDMKKFKVKYDELKN